MSESKKDKDNEEEYLKKHLEGVEGKSQRAPSSPTKDPMDTTRVSDVDFIHFDVNQLPCGKFYPQGTLLMLRSAKVKEIQAYSMVDDTNFPDIVEKMNDMLQSCVKVKYANGELSSYQDIKDQDRMFLIFMIRELTFQKGNTLTVKSVCGDCGHENTLELTRSNFKFHELDEKMTKFYNKSRNCFLFETNYGKEFEITPPTIGIQKAFTNFIIRENAAGIKPNLAFLKIIPFMLNGANSIKYEEIKQRLTEFENIDDKSFQFLNSVVSKMTFGIKEIGKQCENESCGLEIRTDMRFPTGASGVFVIHDAFEAFIKE